MNATEATVDQAAIDNKQRQGGATPAGQARARGGKGVRTRVNDALTAGRRQVRENPFAAIAGAVAVSAGLALLIPASRREAEVMGDVASKIGDVARGAADSAVEAGRAQAETLAQAALASVGTAVIENVVASGGPADTQRQPV